MTVGTWSVSMWGVRPRLGVVPGTTMVIVAVVATAIALALQNAYRSRARVVGPVAGTRIRRAVTVAVVAAITVAVLTGVAASTVRIVVTGALSVVSLSVTRWAASIAEGRRRRRDGSVDRWLLVGANDDAYGLWRHLQSRPDSGRVLVGWVGEDRPGVTSAWNLPRLGDVDDTVRIAADHDVDGVLVAAGTQDRIRQHDIIHDAHEHGLDVELVGGFCGLHHRRLLATRVAHEPVVFVEPRYGDRGRAAAKRVFDLIVGTVLLVVAGPVFVVVAVAIVIDDGFPVFYRQDRIGRNGHGFRLWKFRTMCRDADARIRDLDEVNERSGGPLFKIANDPRVTGVGRRLRAASIDELPQLFNVLTGSMSLVGPRPALPAEVAAFDAELRTRDRVKPGITGLWQIEARDNPDFHAYRQLDLFYVENWSLTLDVAVLACTIPRLVGHARFERRCHVGADAVVPVRSGDSPRSPTDRTAPSAVTDPPLLTAAESR